MKDCILLLAQIPSDQWFTPLLQGGSAAGVLGGIVIWFCLRMEKILEKLREAMERNTNSLMISVLNTKHLDDAIKPLAERLARESEEAMKK